MRKQDRVKQLRRIPLFEGCSKRDLGFLASEARVERLDAGQPLFVEGAPATEIYLILAGTVLVSRNGSQIAKVGVGESIGEIGLLLGKARNASVIAETPIEFLALGREPLKRAIDNVPGLGWKILETLATRLAPGEDSQKAS
jgi:CRP/FNR family cyclic AMP-dependent transcriptional regulator